MLVRKVSQCQIEHSKEVADSFDKIKVYNKIDCVNNWKGYLGELVFEDYLKENGINHTWHNFVKNTYEYPDFTINGEDIDVKVSDDGNLWIQEPKWDKYILMRYEERLSSMIILGYIQRYSLKAKIETGKAKQVIRGKRKDYVLKLTDLKVLTDEMMQKWWK